MRQRPNKHYWILSLIVALPFATLLLFALGQQWFYPSILPRRFTPDNFRALREGSGALPVSVLLSLGISVIVATTATAPAFVASRAIAYHRRRRLFTRLLYLPFAISPVIYGAVLQPLFIRLGLSGHVMGVMLGQWLIAFPYALIFFQSFWTERLREYEGLAATLGADSRATLRQVTVPLGRSTLWVALLQTFLISWFDYGLASIIGLGQVKTMTVTIYQYVTEANIYYAALAGTLLILPPVIFLWLNKRFVFQKMI